MVAVGSRSLEAENMRDLATIKRGYSTHVLRIMARVLRVEGWMLSSRVVRRGYF
jgi:hypothetical protein